MTGTVLSVPQPLSLELTLLLRGYVKTNTLKIDSLVVGFYMDDERLGEQVYMQNIFSI